MATFDGASVATVPSVLGAGRGLSLLLVFFAIIFVCPLHVVYSGAFARLSGRALPSDLLMTGGSADVRALFACFGLAYDRMAGTLTLLFLPSAGISALRGSNNLDARGELRIGCVPTAIGLASAPLALPLSAPGWAWLLPGFMYSLLFPAGPVVGRFNRCNPRS